MKVEQFVENLNSSFFIGVPDSLLRSLCDYLMSIYGIDSEHHIIAANEGNCVSIAAGYYLSTGRIPVVYLQNSGEGNIINPISSLMNKKICGIPSILVIGWRGEPGVHDEPQHIFQGEITLKLLEIMGIDYFIVDKNTNDVEMKIAMKKFQVELENGNIVAFVVKRNALFYEQTINYTNNYCLTREDVIKCIIEVSAQDTIVSTTGKASRELFEIREKDNGCHDHDFMTVGAMGHSSSIALGIAISKPQRKVWCIDGDGALLMHMGALAVIGSINPDNMVHIVINNEAHESVGGLPTVTSKMDLKKIAQNCGYKIAEVVDDINDFKRVLCKVKVENKLSFVEVKCAIGSRKDLGRPTLSAKENKDIFMNKMNDESI